METPAPASFPRKVLVSLVAGWLLILTKCALTPYFIARWEVPVDPGWVIIPTLLFAALITGFVLTHDWAHDDAD